jgi:hypothetical protein
VFAGDGVAHNNLFPRKAFDEDETVAAIEHSAVSSAAVA